MRGRPRFQPTNEQRQNVEALTALGIPQAEICQLVRNSQGKPISENTLRRHFKNEIGAGSVRLKARMGQFLIATIEGRENLPTGMRMIADDRVRGRLLELFLKSRCGFTERQKIEGNLVKPAFIYKASPVDAGL
jgi:hypothetical protein